VQNVLPWMSYDDFKIYMEIIRIHIFMSCYICPKLDMKVLKQTYQIPLYLDAKVSIKPRLS